MQVWLPSFPPISADATSVKALVLPTSVALKLRRTSSLKANSLISLVIVELTHLYFS
jgi:hypothetical protein